MDIRNVAIIAHVDHGKTTLIDGLFKQAGVFEAHKAVEDRVMDSGELEKERGITITAKNASFDWNGAKINIVDTPGHADFGGEVERALHMVDGAILLVDAAEGPLPQTRFVLRKAFERGIKIICVINKVDRPDSRIEVVEEKLLELMYDVALSDDQIDYKTLYASAKNGWASSSKDEQKPDFKDLLDTIVTEIPKPKVDTTGTFKMLVTNLKYSPYVGQIAVGRIESGTVKLNQRVSMIDESGKSHGFNVNSLEAYSGLGTGKVEQLEAGNIALLAGMTDPKIGDTITEDGATETLPRITVDLPSVAVRISINTSPFAGKEGEYVTSRKLEELLERACLENVSLRYEATDSGQVYMLKARGELQIVILLEQLRREGFELMAGRPEIIPTKVDGQQVEPEELVTIDIPEDMVGTVTQLLSSRGGRMDMMEPLEGSSRTRLEFSIPARGLIGLRSIMLTETRGEAIWSSAHKGFIPYQGKRFSRQNGAIVSDRTGQSTEYALFPLQSRGKLFIPAGVQVYEGMVFGECTKTNDMNANPTQGKKLTNMRASGTDASTKLKVTKLMEFDEALEWIDEDEWVEITPESIRIRKQELQTNMRKLHRDR